MRKLVKKISPRLHFSSKAMSRFELLTYDACGD